MKMITKKNRKQKLISHFKTAEFYCLTATRLTNYSLQMRENTAQEKLRIRALFTSENTMKTISN